VPILLAVLNVMGPVLLVAGAGYLTARVRPLELSGLTDTLFFAFLPALVFSSMSTNTLALDAMLRLAVCATLGVCACMLAAQLVLRAQGRRSTGFVLVSSFPNNANMGISLCALAFGQEGTVLATAYYVVTATLTFSLGLYIAAPRGRHLDMFRVPLLYAALLGLFVRFSGLELPTLVTTGVSLLGQAAIPAMLFSLGARLASVQVSDLSLSLQAAALRLGGGFMFGLAAVELLGVQGVARSVILLQATMPAAVINFVIAERYAAEPQLVASSVAVSTLASMLVLPALLAWLMY
jgi:predicted permease